MKAWGAIASALCLFVLGCGSTQTKKEKSSVSQESSEEHTPLETAQPISKQARDRCEAKSADRQVREFDNSLDGKQDLRKVYKVFGEGPTLRLVLICREADLNGDQVLDVVRQYSDEGRPIHEESDRNFDGKMDVATWFETGKLSRAESDSDYDGRIDMKVFYDEKERVLRTERDAFKRSTLAKWRPSHWEYFEQGHLVRMGWDADGDGFVDRWDRDSERKPLADPATSFVETVDTKELVADAGVKLTDAGSKPDSATKKKNEKSR